MIRKTTNQALAMLTGLIVVPVGALLGCRQVDRASDAAPKGGRPHADSLSTLPPPTGNRAASTSLGSSGDWPEESRVRRVGGDPRAATLQDGDYYRSGDCRITTPLPEGYPPPTPPGAIELKRYPAVRRAEVAGWVFPDLGMNFAFFPLFKHIQRRGIAMTSPVEMNYAGLSAVDPASGVDAWTMSFLYRSSGLGPIGADRDDARVAVTDIAPTTVVAVGGRGTYRLSNVRRGVAVLKEWLAKNPQWQAAGDARALFYNGPDVRARDKWYEVQIPVRPTIASGPTPD